jgi:putative DNA primase/helicase
VTEPITSDIPTTTREPNPVRDEMRLKIQKEAELDRKNPVYEISHKLGYPAYADFLEHDDNEKPLPFKPAKVAIWLQKNENFKTDLATGILYFYDGKSWIPNAEPYLECIVSKILDEQNKTTHFKNILHALKGLTYDSLEFSRKIAIPNGLLDPETLETTTNTPEEMPLFSIPTEYVKNSPYPQWQAWLDDVMPNKEDQALLQEWSGYILLPDYRFHKLLFNYGSGRNGKGTWERTIQTIIGKNNVSEIALEEFNGFHRFSLCQLYGKLLNLCSEPTTKYTLETSLLKKLTGQDTISMEFKGANKRLDAINTAKITVSANRFPKVEDTTTAFKERRLFLNWEKEYLENDGTQIQWIERNWLEGEHDERKGIFCWMLEGLQRLLIQGYFTQGKTQKETEILFQRASDTISAFKTEMLIFDKTLTTTRAQAFDAYKEYCDVFGLEAENEKKFTQALKETPKISSTTVSKPSRLRAWKGIGLKILNDDSTVSDVSDVSLVPYCKDSEKSSLEIEEYRERDTSDTSDTVEVKKPENLTLVCGDCGKFHLPSCGFPNGAFEKVPGDWWAGEFKCWVPKQPETPSFDDKG